MNGHPKAIRIAFCLIFILLSPRRWDIHEIGKVLIIACITCMVAVIWWQSIIAIVPFYVKGVRDDGLDDGISCKFSAAIALNDKCRRNRAQ